MKQKLFVFFMGLIVFSGALLGPGNVAHAQRASGGYCSNFSGSIKLGGGATLGDVIRFATCFLTQLIVPLIFAIATIVFLWGVVKFIQAKSTDEKSEGRKFMLWGIIALAVMLSIWGIVSIIGGTFGVKNVVPQLPVNP